ncbi:DUF6706 family protein [Desertivirga xinjiangensis]|uniref:DUF6706 family protein n=1 Tax=Desertivirga xinjiangensis TaxID=539206 RepID=UPI002109C7B1|nr:DUF6706 family protein [Pedobacter xinjiangensis]
MKNREALLDTILIPGVQGRTADLELMRKGLDPEAEFSMNNDAAITDASLAVLFKLRGVKRITEGEFSIELDQDAIEKRIAFLTNGGFDVKPVPTIRDGSYLW